ncbi:Scaffold-type E3 ligase [Agyrium rufum]|nr:Scaffold-type E3 ligase [Agyrium rufum]
MPPAYTSQQKQAIAQFVQITTVKDSVAAKFWSTSLLGMDMDMDDESPSEDESVEDEAELWIPWEENQNPVPVEEPDEDYPETPWLLKGKWPPGSEPGEGPQVFVSKKVQEPPGDNEDDRNSPSQHEEQRTDHLSPRSRLTTEALQKLFTIVANENWEKRATTRADSPNLPERRKIEDEYTGVSNDETDDMDEKIEPTQPYPISAIQPDDSSNNGSDSDSDEEYEDDDFNKSDEEAVNARDVDENEETEDTRVEVANYLARKALFSRWIRASWRKGQWMTFDRLPVVMRFALRRPYMGEALFEKTLKEHDLLDSYNQIELFLDKAFSTDRFRLKGFDPATTYHISQMRDHVPKGLVNLSAKEDDESDSDDSSKDFPNDGPLAVGQPFTSSALPSTSVNRHSTSNDDFEVSHIENIDDISDEQAALAQFSMSLSPERALRFEGIASVIRDFRIHSEYTDFDLSISELVRSIEAMLEPLRLDSPMLESWILNGELQPEYIAREVLLQAQEPPAASETSIPLTTTRPLSPPSTSAPGDDFGYPLTRADTLSPQPSLPIIEGIESTAPRPLPKLTIHVGLEGRFMNTYNDTKKGFITDADALDRFRIAAAQWGHESYEIPALMVKYNIPVDLYYKSDDNLDGRFSSTNDFIDNEPESSRMGAVRNAKDPALAVLPTPRSLHTPKSSWSGNSGLQSILQKPRTPAINFPDSPPTTPKHLQKHSKSVSIELSKNEVFTIPARPEPVVVDEGDEEAPVPDPFAYWEAQTSKDVLHIKDSVAPYRRKDGTPIIDGSEDVEAPVPKAFEYFFKREPDTSKSLSSFLSSDPAHKDEHARFVEEMNISLDEIELPRLVKDDSPNSDEDEKDDPVYKQDEFDSAYMDLDSATSVSTNDAGKRSQSLRASNMPLWTQIDEPKASPEVQGQEHTDFEPFPTFETPTNALPSIEAQRDNPTIHMRRSASPIMTLTRPIIDGIDPLDRAQRISSPSSTPPRGRALTRSNNETHSRPSRSSSSISCGLAAPEPIGGQPMQRISRHSSTASSSSCGSSEDVQYGSSPEDGETSQLHGIRMPTKLARKLRSELPFKKDTEWFRLNPIRSTTPERERAKRYQIVQKFALLPPAISDLMTKEDLAKTLDGADARNPFAQGDTPDKRNQKAINAQYAGKFAMDHENHEDFVNRSISPLRVTTTPLAGNGVCRICKSKKCVCIKAGDVSRITRLKPIKRVDESAHRAQEESWMRRPSIGLPSNAGDRMHVPLPPFNFKVSTTIPGSANAISLGQDVLHNFTTSVTSRSTKSKGKPDLPSKISPLLDTRSSGSEVDDLPEPTMTMEIRKLLQGGNLPMRSDGLIDIDAIIRPLRTALNKTPLTLRVAALMVERREAELNGRNEILLRRLGPTNAVPQKNTREPGVEKKYLQMAKVKAQADDHTFATSSYYSSTPSSTSKTISTTSLSKMFDKFRDMGPTDNPDLMKIDGAIAYLEQIGIRLDEPAVLALHAELEAPTMGEFTRTGFTNGWKVLGADTVSKQTERVNQLRHDLSNDRAVFKRMYKHTFVIAREPGQKAVHLPSALEYWRLLLTKPGLDWNTKETPWLMWWTEFLEQTWKKSVNKDLWDQTLAFVEKSLQDASMDWWSEDGAWPGVLDDFVLYVRKRRGDSAGEKMEE